MGNMLSINSRIPRRTILSLFVSSLLAVSVLATSDLLAASPGYSTHANSGPAVHYTATQREGLRYIYATMSPSKEARIEEIKRDSRNVPAPKFKDLIDGKHPAVVRIDVEGGGNVVYHGTGTLIGVSKEHGLVVTNWHVIRDAVGEVRVRFPDGLVAKATVLKTDKTWDLAALCTARPRVRPVGLSQDVPKIGDALTIAGYGNGSYRQASGRLLQYCAPGMTEPAEILELTAAARQGDSGGPIFAQDGTLAGVLFGSISGTTNGSHVERVRQFLESVLAAEPYDDDEVHSRPVSYSPGN